MNDYMGQLGFQRCRQVVEKLRREFERFDGASTTQERADHAVNFCLTAWHLIDWTHEAAKAGHLTFLGAGDDKPTADGLDDYRDYLRDRCPELSYMDCFANWYKHRDLSPNAKRPPFSTTESATTVMADWDCLAELSTIGQPEVLKIIENGKPIPLRPILETVLDFWLQFIINETAE